MRLATTCCKSVVLILSERTSPVRLRGDLYGRRTVGGRNNLDPAFGADDRRLFCRLRLCTGGGRGRHHTERHSVPKK